MLRTLIFSLFCLTFGSCQVEYEQDNIHANANMQVHKQHIYLAAPSIHEEYYVDDFSSIINFHTQLATAIRQYDEVSVIVDADTKKYFSGKLDDALLIEADVYDIWMRDFGLA